LLGGGKQRAQIFTWRLGRRKTCGWNLVLFERRLASLEGGQ
jgi:hypothetical protein